MCASFERLAEEKQLRILNAAMTEFATRPYRAASTERIAREADISKGSLFAYFGDKRGLYLYLHRWTATRLVARFFSVLPPMPDLLARWQEASRLKLRLLADTPYIFDLLVQMVAETEDAVRTDIAITNAALVSRSMSQMTEGIDTSLFREDIDAQQAIQIILWTLEGFSRAAQAHATAQEQRVTETTLAAIAQEMEPILSLLRKLLYRA